MRERQTGEIAGEIVPMTEATLGAVLAIEAVAFGVEHAETIYREELAREWGFVDLATMRGPNGEIAVVAYCNYWLVRDEVHLLNVATAEAHQRRGHARRLLLHMIEFASRRECRVITLEVRRSNRSAIDLYIDLGFETVGTRPRYYAENNEDALVMLRHLSASSTQS